MSRNEQERLRDIQDAMDRDLPPLQQAIDDLLNET
jgi:hypothetical protein